MALPDRWYCDTVPTTKFPVWSRGNAGEVYPMPATPFAGTGMFFTAGELGYQDAFVEAGTLDHDEYDPSPNNLIGCFGGYLYLNMSLARLYGVRCPGMTPEMVDQQYYGDLSGIPAYAEEARPTDESPEHTERLGAWIAGEVFGVDTVPENDEHRRAALAVVAGRPDLTTLTPAELVGRLGKDFDLYRDMFRRHILNSAALGLGIGTVSGVCAAVGRPELAMPLISGVGEVDSAAPSQAMWDLSRRVNGSDELAAAFDGGVEGALDRIRASSADDASAFLAALDEFLAAYGSRGPNEWEPRAETWGTRPEIALAAVGSMRGAPDADQPLARAGVLAAEREVAAAEVRGLLEGADEQTRQQFEAGLRAAVVFGAARERSKTNCIFVVHEDRLVARELGRRAVEAGALDRLDQVFMLTHDELEPFVADMAGFTEVARQREEQYEELRRREPPFFVVGDPPPLSEFPRRDARSAAPVAAGDVLSGISGCAGVHRGRARIVHDPGDPAGLEPGDVLVAPVTDPAWTPLFVAAGAVVVDVGAQITHAVIVSRELGLPCVVSVKDATRRIPDGSLVEVDGAAGTVTVLEVA